MLSLIPVGKLVFELDCVDDVDAFEQIAHIQEVFGFQHCPRFERGQGDSRKVSDNVVFSVRENDGNKYYEMRCQEKPYARFKFGQTKKGNHLFPKREGGVYGWWIYNQETKQEE